LHFPAEENIPKVRPETIRSIPAAACSGAAENSAVAQKAQALISLGIEGIAR
jgi:hypothetical protein